MIPAFDLTSPALALGSALVLGFLVGILPVGLAEVLAVAIGLVQPTALALAMLLAFTIAHVAAKVPWYGLGTLAEGVERPWARAFIARARELMARYPRYGAGVLALSALTSVPPFHLASIAAGLARIPFGRFVLICLAGRLVRFGVLASAPALLRAWIG